MHSESGIFNAPPTAMDTISPKRAAPDQKWPHTIWLVRHGQSAGNVARAAAEAAGLPLIDILTRDVDTPLSDLGRQQSFALGRWFAEMDADERPTVLLCSPYVRAQETAKIVLEGAGVARDTITREYRRERVVIVSHQVVVTCFRYLFERLDERQILDLDRADIVANCSVTSYEFDPAVGKHGKLVPKLMGFVAPLIEAGASVTAEKDEQIAPKS